jgi:hypothetical protein
VDCLERTGEEGSWTISMYLGIWEEGFMDYYKISRDWGGKFRGLFQGI